MRRPLAIVLLGSVVAPLDSAVNAAFPAINQAFGLEVAAIRWVVICYLLAFSSCVIVSGRLGDLFGYRKVFGTGLLLSAAAFLACGLAPGYGWLLAARVVQGVGIALVLGAGPALALSIHAESERTRVLGWFGAAFGVGLAVGPAVGGVLVDAFGWQSVFLARVPLALAAWLLLGGVPVAPIPPGRRFDAAGALLLAIWTGSLLLAIALPGGPALAAGVVAAAGFTLFVAREARSREPMFRPSLFRSAAFSVPNLAAVAVHFNGFLVFLLGPYLFVGTLGLSAKAAGLLLALGPAAAAAGSALAERMTRSLGVRRIAFAGMLLDFMGVAVASTWDGSSSLMVISAVLAVQGFGIGMFQVAYADIVIGALPPQERGVASSLTNLTRTFGVVSCAAIGAALFSSAQSAALAGGAEAGAAFVMGYANAFGSVAIGAAVFTLLTLLRYRAWFSRQ